MPSSGDLYTAPAGEVDYELVRDFVVSAEDASMFSESLTLEVKEKLSKGNVAALGNSDGGIVLVGGRGGYCGLHPAMAAAVGKKRNKPIRAGRVRDRGGSW